MLQNKLIQCVITHRGLTFFAVLLLLVVRSYSRLYHADFWAEDGALFFSQALEFGFSSIWIVYAQNILILQRLMIWVFIQLLPLTHLPLWIALFCLTVTSYVFSLIAHSDYEWLLKRQAIRIAMALLFCLSPGLNEMLGNLANLNWILYLYVGLQLLKDPKSKISWGHQLVILICAFSLGTGIFLIPLALWRLWVVSKNNRASSLGALVSLSLSLLPLIYLRFTSANAGASLPLLPTTEILFNLTSRYGIAHPWLGDKFLLKTIHYTWGRIGIVIFSIAFFASVFRSKGKAKIGVLIFFVGLFLWSPACWMSRKEVLWAFTQYFPEHFVMRYAFPYSIGALFLWFYLLEKRRSPFLCLLLIALTIGHSAYRFKIGPYGVENRWKPHAEIIARAYKNREFLDIVIPTQPEGVVIPIRMNHSKLRS